MTRNTFIDRLKESDRAVSPVIGVILMVAITVILAAVIGTFVLDLGQSAGNSAPSASLTVTADTTTDSFEISHKGGDSLQSDSTRIQIENVSGSNTMTWDPASSTSFGVGSSMNASVTNENVKVDGTVVYGTGDQSGSAFSGVNSGSQYAISIIDTESQRVIFETTITA